MLRGKTIAASFVAMGLFTGSAAARVVEFQIQSSEGIFDGQTFGDTGAYERIDAIATFAVDPSAPENDAIVDIGKAPRNEDGEVVFSTEVSILRPTESSKRSGFMFYEVPNRGRNLSFMLLNRSGSSAVPKTADDAGDGFLMKRGDTIVWSGWQTHLPDDKLNLELPQANGVRGFSREQVIFDKPGASGKLTLTYPAADLDQTKATLTVRTKEGDPRQTPEDLTFSYLSPTEIEINRPAGAKDGAIYEFIYPAKDAVPAGLAFAATRDLVSFLRGNPGHDATSPITGVEHTVAMGISQSGRFLRDLIYQGFNADENGKRVFDGAMAHIAGSRKTFTNYRFAQPGRYSRQHEDHDYPGDQFPFTYAMTTDPLSGRRDSLLAACTATDTCPRIMHTDTSTEFWQARAFLLTTSPEGEALTMPENVRLYFIAGAPHFNSWAAKSTENAVCANPTNPLSSAPIMRALYAAMEDWVANGTEPPASQYPSNSDETLVPLEDLTLPVIDGKSAQPSFNVLQVMDHSQQPPARGATYPVLVPSVDADGIPQGGVRLPYVAAPLGTYAGWNLRKPGFGEGDLCSLTGSYQAFPATASDADSRSPLEARYEDQSSYLEAVKSAAEDLVEERLMLADDIEYVLQKASDNSAALLH